jgi:hypothetical protein
LRLFLRRHGILWLLLITIKLTSGVFMEFIDYMWIKAGVLCVAAFVYGLWKGFTDREDD